MSNEFPDNHHIIVYNRRIRSQLKKKEAAFQKAGEKLKAMRDDLNQERRDRRKKDSKISKLETKLIDTKAELMKFKQLYGTLIKDHSKVRKDCAEAFHRMHEAQERQRKAEEKVNRIKACLK